MEHGKRDVMERGKRDVMERGKSDYPHQIPVRTIGDYLREVDRLQCEWEEDEQNIYLSSAWLRGVSNCKQRL